jgi:hypothetical protein
MAPGTLSPLASLHGLTLEQIAALDTTDEILRRIVPQTAEVPQFAPAAFNSAI